jgi:hypothetical protein
VCGEPPHGVYVWTAGHLSRNAILLVRVVLFPPPPPSSCLPTQVVITLSEEELRQIVDTHYDALFSEIQSERQAAHQSTTSFCLFSWQQGNRPTHLWDV